MQAGSRRNCQFLAGLDSHTTSVACRNQAERQNLDAVNPRPLHGRSPGAGGLFGIRELDQARRPGGTQDDDQADPTYDLSWAARTSLQSGRGLPVSMNHIEEHAAHFQE